MSDPRMYRIVAGEGPYLAVVDQEGNMVLPGLDLRNEKEVIENLREKAQAEGFTFRIVRGSGGKIERIEVQRPIPITFYIAPEFDQLLRELARRTGDPTAEVFRKAIALYKLALDAKDNGMRVGAVSDPETMIDTEFVGF